MTNGFTRQETIALTNIKSSRLSYWDETDLVKPQKIGKGKKPKVIYSWQQILQLKIISRLREELSLQEIRKVVDFLEGRNYNTSLFKCRLFLINSELFLVEDNKELGDLVIKASGKDKGQVVVRELEPFKTILAGLKKEAKDNHILDFEKRIKGTALEFALK
jgi:DNA-binding transcriptional MerR regulator